jgi:hypothetical protein
MIYNHFPLFLEKKIKLLRVRAKDFNNFIHPEREYGEFPIALCAN